MARYRMIKGIKVRCCGRKITKKELDEDLWWEYVKRWKAYDQEEAFCRSDNTCSTDTCGYMEERVIYICPDCIQRAGFLW